MQVPEANTECTRLDRSTPPTPTTNGSCLNGREVARRSTHKDEISAMSSMERSESQIVMRKVNSDIRRDERVAVVIKCKIEVQKRYHT